MGQGSNGENQGAPGLHIRIILQFITETCLFSGFYLDFVKDEKWPILDTRRP